RFDCDWSSDVCSSDLECDVRLAVARVDDDTLRTVGDAGFGGEYRGGDEHRRERGRWPVQGSMSPHTHAANLTRVGLCRHVAARRSEERRVGRGWWSAR